MGENYEEHTIFIKAYIKADKKTVRKYSVHFLEEIKIFQGSSAFVTLRFLHRKIMLVRKYNISGHENIYYIEGLCSKSKTIILCVCVWLKVPTKLSELVVIYSSITLKD